MAEREMMPGVSGMSLYVPPYRVRLEDWCRWTGGCWDKVQSVVGRSFRVCGRDENAYTMAASAVLSLIERYDIDPRRVGFLGLGTESSTDNSAGAVIVRGMIDRALAERGQGRLARDIEVPEFKHACLGGLYALKGALRYALSDGQDRQAIVVCSDIAEYERGTSGEQTQGAGAVAMLVERRPRLFEVDLFHAGSASDYRGPDFRKPFARHFTEAYSRGARRPTDYPVFSGKYSTFAYLDETAWAFDRMLARLGRSAMSFFEEARSVFFHRPYHLMPVQAMGFLYVRALATEPSRAEELGVLCEAAGVSPEAVREEGRSEPDLFGRVLLGESDAHPYPATSAVASGVRKSLAFRKLLEEKMSLGTERVMDLGNLYTAALPAWVAAGLEEAVVDGADLAGAPLALIGYGSGDAAEAVPARVTADWKTAARAIGWSEALAGSIDLSQAQYEALHDGTPVTLPRSARRRFAIARVGDRYEPSFQDLCVEYYDYVA